MKILIYNLICPSVDNFKLCAFVCTSPIVLPAAGEVLPPHIEYQSKRQSQLKQCNLVMMSWSMCLRSLGSLAVTRCVHGQYPLDRTRREGWMKNEEEFAKCLLNSIASVALFPNAKDKSGHRVLLKVDSGLGRMNL